MRYPNQPPKNPKPKVGIPSHYPLSNPKPSAIPRLPRIRVDFTEVKKILKNLDKAKLSVLKNMMGWWCVKNSGGKPIAYFREEFLADEFVAKNNACSIEEIK